MPYSRPVRKAVLPVAGLGTRFLPETKIIPKEMLPVVDKPVVQYAVEEAMEAGIEEFVLVTSRGKGAIEDHFDMAYELEAVLGERAKTVELENLRAMLPPAGSCAFVRQPTPLGLGHAVWCARNFIGNEPFAVLLPDDLLVGKPGAMTQMIESYHQVGGGCIIAAEEKPLEEVKRYGVIAPGEKNGKATEVTALVEKPAPENAPSRLCIIGRYILQPEIFDVLARNEKGAGGEIQLTDAMARLIGKMPFHAVETSCARYDCGDKVGFLTANLAVALARPDIAPGLKQAIRTLQEHGELL